MFSSCIDRRNFLKASCLAALSLCGGGSALAALPREGLPVGRLSLFNTHTGEDLVVTFRDAAGEYDLDALARINHFLRCHYTGEECRMDVRTIEFLSLVDRRLGGGREIHVISGYRSPEYNQMLLRQGRKVAKNSLHLQGRAIDIRFPGIKADTVRRTALGLRFGGVGYYPKSNFVHLDSGDFRTW